MENGMITISIERFTALCQAEMALKILEKNRMALYEHKRLTVLDAVLDTFTKEEPAC